MFEQLGCTAEIVSTTPLLLTALTHPANHVPHTYVIISDNQKYDSNQVGASVRALSLASAPKLILLTLPITQTLSSDVFDQVLLRPVFAHDLRRTLLGNNEALALQRELPSADRPRILLAEDNHASQQALSAALEKLGYAPQLVDHGAAAVKAATERQFAAIILDVHMPVMDGVSAARLIRDMEIKKGQSPQVILGLTGSNDEAQRAACLATGMNDVIAKPVMIDQLQEILQKYIRTPRRG
jgi:CheY-like chemotaxis protein